MPFPTHRTGRSADWGTEACSDIMGPSERKVETEGGRSREGPPARSDREEACDKRSAPQDVTSSWVRRGGVNLQPEVVPQPTERPPRDSPIEDTPDGTPGAKLLNGLQCQGAYRERARFSCS